MYSAVELSFHYIMAYGSASLFQSCQEAARSSRSHWATLNEHSLQRWTCHVEAIIIKQLAVRTMPAPFTFFGVAINGRIVQTPPTTLEIPSNTAGQCSSPAHFFGVAKIGVSLSIACTSEHMELLYIIMCSV